eukprot:TRINITY_DN61113_c0_g1_i1.p1 TRINITY_DN61113_c0_g1~~TRINITY_DN61113_c0_g1_i1.p1  ORF type:complete len:1004 (-),score=202.48 TRINITY_DN61113_c0_g1_i1:57-2858(-)
MIADARPSGEMATPSRPRRSSEDASNTQITQQAATVVDAQSTDELQTFSLAVDHKEYLETLQRYAAWCRKNTRRKSERNMGGVADFGRVSREVIVKGLGCQASITEEDVALLSEAMPLVINSLGLVPEVAAYGFQAYSVEAGNEIWREDTDIHHMYIVGNGASIAISRGGRPIRDVGVGQSLGSEALTSRVSWPHTAVVRRAGIVWAMETLVFRELLTASTAKGEMFGQVSSLFRQSHLFQLSKSLQVVMLAAHAEHAKVAQGSVLARSGDVDDRLYVLQSGAVEATTEGQPTHVCRTPGYCFGETAFSSKGQARQATLVAQTDSSVLALPHVFLETVFDFSVSSLVSRNVVLQAFLERPSLVQLRQESLDAWIERLQVHRFDAGANILDTVDSAKLEIGGLIVVIHGEAVVTPVGRAASETHQTYSVLGEDNLMNPVGNWLKSCKAGPVGVSLAVLPKAYWEKVFCGCPTVSDCRAFQERIELVRKVFLFRHLSDKQCADLVSSMALVRTKKGDVVVKEGDRGAEFFLIHEGEVCITKAGNFIMKLSKPAYFGERALLYEDPRAATATVVSEEATFCVLTKKCFLDILNAGLLDFIAYRNKLLDTDLQFSDLEAMKIIGRGGYGTVKLVRHKKSHTRYALKCVTRGRLSDQDRSLVQRERAILQLIDHPFCLKLVRSFKDSNCVYFLTELVTGGELLDALDRLDVLDKPQAQFYLGSLLLCFEYIHERHVIYRDLKPENVLLDQDGFVKLIDFGAARKLDSLEQKCFTLLGTPHFMAVEMILGDGYGMSADIWAMGVCLYEFMVGRLPFDGDKPVAIFRQIASNKPMWIPEDLDPATTDMLRWLLEKNPADRVQATRRGYQAMRDHPFFQGFDFSALEQRSIKPPCIPEREQYSEDVDVASVIDVVDPHRSVSSFNDGVNTVEQACGWDADF